MVGYPVAGKNGVVGSERQGSGWIVGKNEAACAADASREAVERLDRRI